MQEHIQTKHGDRRASVIDKEKTLELLKRVLKRPMPKFAIYSRLDKDLLKNMLIKATMIEDEDIMML